MQLLKEALQGKLGLNCAVFYRRSRSIFLNRFNNIYSAGEGRVARCRKQHFAIVLKSNAIFTRAIAINFKPMLCGMLTFFTGNVQALIRLPCPNLCHVLRLLLEPRNS